MRRKEGKRRNDKEEKEIGINVARRSIIIVIMLTVMLIIMFLCCQLFPLLFPFLHSFSPLILLMLFFADYVANNYVYINNSNA